MRHALLCDSAESCVNDTVVTEQSKPTLSSELCMLLLIRNVLRLCM